MGASCELEEEQIVEADCMGKMLHQHGFAGLRRRYDQCPLSLANRAKEIHNSHRGVPDPVSYLFWSGLKPDVLEWRDNFVVGEFFQSFPRLSLQAIHMLNVLNLRAFPPSSVQSSLQ